MIGPLGAFALARTIITSFQEWREPKLGYADTDEVEALEDQFREFIPAVFGFAYEDCFISNDSTLGHFVDDEEQRAQVHERIRSVYGVDATLLEDDRLVTVVAAIAARPTTSQ